MDLVVRVPGSSPSVGSGRIGGGGGGGGGRDTHAGKISCPYSWGREWNTLQHEPPPVFGGDWDRVHTYARQKSPFC